MRFIDLRHLSGPNVFTSSPVAVARLELDELTGQETTGQPGFAARLAALLPGLAGHHCASGRPGGFLAAMDRGTYFGHVTEHVALELSSLAGREVSLGKTMWAGADGRYDVMMECPLDEPEDSAVPALLLRLAMRVTQEVLAGGTPETGSELAVIGCLIERERLGVSTAAIAAAARRRGLPVRRLGGLSMLQLGYGRARRLVCAALTEQTSALGVDIAADKMLAKRLLAGAGICVPPAIVAGTAEEAREALAELGAPVVIKPLGGSQGRSVTVGVRGPDEAQAAFALASAAGQAVLVEGYVPGRDYRVLVIDGEVAAAAELRPAAVTGDGTHTIGQLVEIANADPRRGEGHARELTRIVVDDEVRRHLDAAGLDGCSVPRAGQLVTLRRNANLSTGGTSRDVTDLVHPDVAELCRRAAAAVGLDICGIDLRLADIGAVTGGAVTGGAVIEVNASPGLRMHLSPAEGRPRDVATAVVGRLYPPGAPLRVPVISVTGTNGKTTTVRMIARVLGEAGLRVGMATTDGVYSGGRLVYEADASGPRSARMVLDDPAVEAAVLETARGGIIRGGLGYDQADVAVVTNITADHLGVDGVDDLDELVHVKALVAEEIRPGGTVVLNADDPASAGLARRPAVLRRDPDIRLFTLRAGCPLVRRHLLRGGTCYEVRDGAIVEARGSAAEPVIALAELPGSFGGRAAHVVANALAAVAACRAAGISVTDIRRGLAGFGPGEANPGRGNVYRAGDLPVIVDYGHNAAALHATGSMIAEVWGDGPAAGWRDRAGGGAGGGGASGRGGADAGDGGGGDWRGTAAAALTLPGDRRDDLVAESAEAVAAWCATVVVYEDSDRRGRRAGEMAELIAGVLRRARPGITCELADGPEQALRRAVALAGGAPVLFVYEKLAAARAALDAIGATPWPDAAPTAGRPGVQRPGVQGPGVQGPDPQQDIAAQVDEVLAAAGGMTAGGAFSGGTAPADASADYERRSGDDEPESDQAAVPA